jgi:hypothetical protein
MLINQTYGKFLFIIYLFALFLFIFIIYFTFLHLFIIQVLLFHYYPPIRKIALTFAPSSFELDLSIWDISLDSSAVSTKTLLSSSLSSSLPYASPLEYFPPSSIFPHNDNINRFIPNYINIEYFIEDTTNTEINLDSKSKRKRDDKTSPNLTNNYDNNYNKGKGKKKVFPFINSVREVKTDASTHFSISSPFSIFG